MAPSFDRRVAGTLGPTSRHRGADGVAIRAAPMTLDPGTSSRTAALRLGCCV
jgi:hypothetical protein